MIAANKLACIAFIDSSEGGEKEKNNGTFLNRCEISRLLSEINRWILPSSYYIVCRSLLIKNCLVNIHLTTATATNSNNKWILRLPSFRYLHDLRMYIN